MFSWWLGLALHATEPDKPEIQLNNPIGIVELDYRFGEKVTGYCRHESGLFHVEQGYGYNQCGIKLRIR